LDIPWRSMTDRRKYSYRFRSDRVALIAWSALATAFGPLASAPAAAQLTLEVEASHGLPGLHHSALSRFLAAHMTEAGLTDWRFEPAGSDGLAANRVEWTFKLSPYAGGEVRSFVPTLTHEWRRGIHRLIMIEARLYLNGQYQTLVEQQANVQGGPDDPDLAAAVAKVTQNLLGPSGAYRAMDTGQRRADQTR
jgi:hypothetical protein